MINPIDKDKVAENPGLMAYPHSIGSLMVKPEDVGKLKSRALSAMYEQTNTQLMQIQKQVELMVNQANEIKRRVSISEQVYTAHISFEPFVGSVYHLYNQNDKNFLMMIGPHEWGRSRKGGMEFVASVRLLSDHTWEVI